MSKKQLTPLELASVRKLKLKKAKVPLKTCLKLALKNMWKKKFRYLIMFLICALSLSFLSVTIELNGEKLRQNVYTMIENGYRFTEIYKHVEATDDEIKENIYNNYKSEILSDNSYEQIKNDIPNIVLHEYNTIDIKYVSGEIENKNYFYTGSINTIIKFDPSNTYELLAGRLPAEGTKEILITDYLVECFKYFNIYPSCDTVYEFLNQRLSLTHNDNYIIVGIIKTNYQNWSHFINVETVKTEDKENYSFQNDFIFMNSVILSEEYFDLEKTGTSSIIPLSNYTNASVNSTAHWSFSTNDINNIDPNSDIVTYSSNGSIGLTHNNLEIIKARRYTFGTHPQNDDEIVISWQLANKLFGYSWQQDLNHKDYYLAGRHYEWWSNIVNKEITLTLSGFLEDSPTYTKTYKIVGISESTGTAAYPNSPLYQVTNDEYQKIYYTYNNKEEKVLVELPNSSVQAYDLFNQAYDSGYVINVWAYQTDIDTYNIDPFLDLASKAGLFIFTAFTMGIMWTIISIEIVDSKKEIGILRSIGLSGSKVSFIFVFQCASVIILSYFLGVYGAYKIIPYLNVGITDEFNKITLYLYSFTYRTPLYLGIFVFIMVTISTVIPLSKILSNKIIDVINERDN